MESVLKAIANLSTPEDLLLLHQKLQSYEKIINQNQDQLLNAIQHLDVYKHSLGYLFFLCSRFETIASLPPPHQESWLGFATRFLVGFNVAQVKCDERRLFRFCKSFTATLFSTRNNQQKYALKALPALNSVLTRLVPTGEVTSLHSDFLRLCIYTGHYDLAEPIIQGQYTSLNKEKTGIEPKHFITFAYYAGCVALVLKNLPKALHFLSLSISTPSLVLHSAAVEAYKKYILVSLMLNGTAKPIPKHSSTVMFYFAKDICEAYIKLAEAFALRDAQALDAVIQAFSSEFQRDKNQGLIKQVREAYTHQEVKRITNSYMTISLRSLAQSAARSVSEVEALLLQMIEEGQINAKIDVEHEMVVFSETEEDSIELVDRMSRVTDRLMELVGETELRIENLMLSREYIKKTITSSFGMGAGGDQAELLGFLQQ